MHNIFITEKQYKILKEAIDNNHLSDDVLYSCNENIYKYIPRTLKEKLISKRYNKILKKINDLNIDSNIEISSLVSKILKKEEPIKEHLEQICASSLFNLFSIPEDLISFSCNLVNEINNSNTKFLVSPIEDDKFEYDDLRQMKILDSEIQKRINLNTLIIGGANILSKNVLSKIKPEIDKLDSELYNLYINLLWLNELALFKKSLKPTDKNPQLGGNVVITLGNETEKTKIESKALLLPILIYESIKGFLDLFISHGLPEETNQVKYILQRSDCLEYEQSSMIFGPIIWNLIMNATGKENFETEEMPYFLEQLSKIDSKKLEKIFSEVLYKTKKGKEIISNIANDIRNEIDYDDFQSRLNDKREKSLMLDEYLNSDELLANNM